MEVDVKCGLEVHDEFPNFSNKSELNGNEYHESVILAKISAKIENFTSKNIKGLIKNGMVYYCINNFFGVFKDMEFSSSIFIHQIEHIIDAILVDNSSTVYLFSQTGTLYIFKFNNEVYSLTSEMKLMVNNSNVDFLSNAYEIDQDENEGKSFILILKKGQIFELNLESDSEFSFRMLKDLNENVNVSTFSNNLLFVNGSQKFWVLNTITSNLKSTKALDMKYSKFIKSNGMVLALLKNETLVEICPFTLLYFPVETSTENLDSMLVFTDENCSVQYITGISNDKLYYFDSAFSLIYSVKIPKETSLILPESKDDEICYISHFETDQNAQEFIFKSVRETNPLEKIKRLLIKKKFDEAEEYAKIHNIDFEIIKKEKAKSIIEKSKCNAKDVENLLNLFENFKEILFILKCPEQISCENPEDYLKLLEFCAKLNISDNEILLIKKQHIVCRELFLRFTVFNLLGYEMEKWSDFSKTPLIFEVKHFLKAKNVQNASLVFTQMSLKEKKSITLDRVEEILELLNLIEFGNLSPFFTVFMKVAIENDSESLNLFIKWVEKKIRENQFSSDEYPENVLQFLIENYPNGKIQKILANLRDVASLKKYGIKLMLEDFEQDPENVLKLVLKSQLPVEIYNELLNNFVYNYISVHKLDDGIFWNELINKLNETEECWIRIVPSILNCFRSNELVLKGLEKVLHRANTPYSESILSLVKNKMVQLAHLDLKNIHACIQNEDVLLILKKYESKDNEFDVDFINIFNFQRTIARMIMQNSNSIIEDVLFLCKGNNDFLPEAMKQLFVHFVIEHGDFEKSSQILVGKAETIRKSLERILIHIRTWSSFRLDEEVRENLLSSLIILVQSYEKLNLPKFEMENYISSIKILKRFHYLNKNYNLKIKLETSDPKLDNSTLKQILLQILEKYENNESNYDVGVQKLFVEIQKLSLHSGYKWEELIIQLCEHYQSDNIQLFLKKIGKTFLKSSTKTEYLSLLSVFILHNLCDDFSNRSFNNTFVGDSTMLDENIGDIELLKLAKSMAEKALSNAEVHQISACLNLIVWTDSIYFIKKKKIGTGEIVEKVENFEKNLNPSVISLTAIMKIFNIFTALTSDDSRNDFKYLTHFVRSKRGRKVSALDELENFKLVACILQNDGDVLLLHRLLSSLENQIDFHEIKHENFVNLLKEIMRTHCYDDFFKMFIREVNENYLEIALIYGGHAKLEENMQCALQLNRKCPKNIEIIARVGRDVSNFYKHFSLKEFCEATLLKVKWYYKTENLNFEYYKFFTTSSEERLNMLMNCENFEFSLIKPYCEDYDLNHKLHYFYLNFLKITLLKFKPEYDVEINAKNNRKLVLKTNLDDLYSKCVKIIQEIETKLLVHQTLIEVWSKLNFYYYESFEVILRIFQNLQDDCGKTYRKEERMLFFLSKYKRTSPPSVIELEKWADISPENPTIDPLSEFRILFNVTILESKDIREIIKNEVTLKNCKRWLDAVAIFSNLSVDNICWSLVHGIVERSEIYSTKQSESYRSWLISRNELILNQIDEYLKEMHSAENRIAASYHLFSHIPEGADKVTFGKIMYDYAEANKDSINFDVFNKIVKNYKRCLALKVLHTFELSDPKYINSVNNFEKLLEIFYSDERIIEGNIQYLHEAIKQLSEVFEFDIVEFQQNIIKKCLGNQSDCNFSIEDYQFKTAKFVCTSSIERWTSFLLNETSKNSRNDSYFKWRCLMCLIELRGKEDIGKILNINCNVLEDVLMKYELCHVLSQFGITLKNVTSWSTVMKQLSVVGDVKSVRAQAVICKQKVDKIKYWKYIIKKAVQLGMFDDLKDFLNHVGENEEMMNEAFYVESWQKLIEYRFISNLKIKEDVSKFEKKMVEDFLLVQSCSVLVMLKFDKIFEKFLHENCLECAAIFAQYVPKEKSLLLRNRITSSNMLKEIMEKLEKYKSRGVVIYNVTNLEVKFNL